LARNGKTILIVTHDPSITQRTDQTITLSDGEIIDQVVARALPFLSHPQMLAATQKAKKQKIAAGETILQQGESVDHLFMIESGEVEIVIKNEQSKEMKLARLGHGQFFGEVELTQGGHSIARVQGAGNGAELALLPKETFYELIDGSPLTRHSIHEIAETRLAENKRRKTDQ
jgi:CRP-like cAMP-binding protein